MFLCSINLSASLVLERPKAEGDTTVENPAQQAASHPAAPPVPVRPELWRLLGGRQVITMVSVGTAFLVWYLLAALEVVPPLFVPHPRQVWASFVEILLEGYRGKALWVHLADSMFRLGSAYLLAVVTAIPLGLLSGYSEKVQAALDWMIEFYRPLPPLAYYVLLVIWLGIENGSKIALLYLAAFAPVYIAAVEGVRGTNKERINAILTLGANNWQVFRYVVFPSCLPEIFTGLRVALGVTYSTLVAAEMVAAVSGIGWMVLDAGKFLRSDIIFLGILIMGVTGILLDRLIRALERRCVPWRGKA